MTRPVIAVDIDDVLSMTAIGFSQYSNQTWGLDTRPEDYTEEWAAFWGVPPEKATEWAKEYHLTDAYYYYEHFVEAYPVLKSLKENYDLVVVTSRRKEMQDYTQKWLDERFPSIFKEIRFAGIWDVKGKTLQKLRQTKAEICRELGAEYLIDDQPKHCLAAQEAGIQSVLFGGYPWGCREDIPNGVVLAHNWREIQEYFDAKS